MKRILTICASLLIAVHCFSQTGEIKPITAKPLQAPNNATWYFNTPDTAVWIAMGVYGQLKLASNQQLVKYYVPYKGANDTLDLGSQLITSKKQLLPLFNGACVIPTILDNGDGTITVGNGEYHVSTRTDGKGTQSYIITGGIFSLTDNTTNYLVADYNNGTPILHVITDVNLINETTVVPIYTAYRSGNVLHFQNWDALGVALANKVHQSIVKTQRYRRESGLGISEVATRYLSVGNGRVWVGAVPVSVDAIVTSSDNLRLFYHSGGVWTYSLQTQYNNSQYDNGTNLVSLTANRYAVNWIFRGIESQKHLYVVLGRGDYTLAQAQEAVLPSIPTAISSHAMLIGKLIVQNGATTATSIQSAFEVQFSTATPNAHNDLTGRDVADVHPAGSITFTPTGTYTATTVAGALAQIDSKTVDRSNTNELQTLSISSSGTTRTITISSGNSVGIDVADNDNSPMNELNSSVSWTDATNTLGVVDSGGTKTVEITGFEGTLTKGNLTAGSTKISIGGSGINALIGTGASVDVNEGNLTLSNIGGSVTDAQVPNTITLDNITQITNRSHTSLTDIGTNTHPQIDTFIASKGQNNGLATLDSGGKVPFAQLPSTLMIYKGNWSPLTNTPTLADGIGTAGWVYRANLSGSVNLGSGTISFYAGDWIIYNGSTWERSVGTDNVISVNGQQGVVSLNTSHITENTNLYFTDARSRASISENITGIDYNNTTGVFSQTSGYGIPTTTQISQIHPQGTDIQAPTLIGDNIGLTQTTTTISISGKEDKSNKVTSLSGSSTDTQYPSAKLLYDQLATKAPASGSGNYIQNQNSSAQNANMWILSGRFGGDDYNIYTNRTGSNNGISGQSYINQIIGNGGNGFELFSTDGTLSLGANNTQGLIFSSTNAATFASTIQATTAKLTNLTDGYIPYHINDASGLVNSSLEVISNNIYNRGGAYFSQREDAGYYGTSNIGEITGYVGFNQYTGTSLNSSNTSPVIITVNNSESLRIINGGNVGIGYSSGTEITNNKLAVNGSGYFNGTVNSTGYLLNGNNLFSSLSTNAAAKWDGTKFINGDYAPASGSGNYIWNGTSQQTANFNINGSATSRNAVIGTDEYTGTPLLIQTGRYANAIQIIGRWDNYGYIEFFGNNRSTLLGAIYGWDDGLHFDGAATFASTVRSTGYLLNGNNLFSSLSSGYLPYWDGSKFINSDFRYLIPPQGYSAFGIQSADQSTSRMLFINGGSAFSLIAGKNNSSQSGFSIYDNTQNRTPFYIDINSNIILSSLSGTGTRIVTASSTGQLTPITNASGFLKNDGSGNFSYWNPSVQSLSGTTPTWTTTSGVNAKITITAATTIYMMGLVSGQTGNITITNPATAYKLKFTGYTLKISPALTADSGGILLSGSSKTDVLSWYYDGDYVIINGTLSYQSFSY